ncbi:arachidonate 5-lipoxygenase-activating protein isoform X1 [Lynx rufus]|uniref:arachidonate 5-lipoxygenase-activating protein isoform X1 n=1 Tax=Lynx rufus TaxID=61384 RepID=UPI001F12665F|nr:arachidonate 5-lipoxygenase-activating protein isoform X1 [Lynx rufus]
MDQETVGNIVLLAIVTLISVVQNGFFAHKVEHESKTQNGRSFQRTGTLAFERVYTAKVSSGLAVMLTHLDRGPGRPIWTSDLQMICLVLSPDVWGYLFQQPQKTHAVTLRAHTAAPKLCGRVPHVPCRALERGAALQPSSRRLCWPDVPVREAKILRRLPGGENSEHTGLHIWEANHTVPVPHVPCRNLQLLSHLLFRK